VRGHLPVHVGLGVLRHVIVVPLVASITRVEGGPGSMLRIAIESSDKVGKDHPVRLHALGQEALLCQLVGHRLLGQVLHLNELIGHCRSPRVLRGRLVCCSNSRRDRGSHDGLHAGRSARLAPWLQL